MQKENRIYSLEEVYQAIDSLRQNVVEEGNKLYQKWLPLIEREAFKESAQNLAYYVALRRRDIRELQEQLSQLGLSSLGRMEAKVLPQLNMIVLVLKKILDKPINDLERISQEEMEKMSYDLLNENYKRVLGPKSTERYTGIMVTMPIQASEDLDFVVNLLENGMEIVRINCGHDDKNIWEKMVKNIRRAEKKTKRSCRIYYDIAGPKIRVDSFYSKKKDARLKVNDTFFITGEERLYNFYDQEIVLGCKNKDILENLEKGDTVALDDGVIEGRVIEVKPEGAIIRVDIASKEKGVRVKAEKGINFPNTKIKIPLITEKDRKDLIDVQENMDMLGISFVKDVSDIESVQETLVDIYGKEKAKAIPIIVKIETLQSIDNLVDIIIASAGKSDFGIMIARGDLAVEAGFLRLSELQEEILWICEAAHIPVIWATQVLETLVKDGIPTRAEITDAAMGARAECVMLNKGDFLEEGVSLLHDILVQQQAHQYKKSSKLRALGIAEKAWTRAEKE